MVTTDEERVARARGGLNRNQAVQISRLSSGKSFVGKSKKFIFNAFIDFKPTYRFENRGDVTEFGSLNHSPGKTQFSLLSGIFAAFLAQFFL